MQANKVVIIEKQKRDFVNNEKWQIRKKIFKIFRKIPYSEVYVKSQKILDKILQLPDFQKAQKVFTYVSFGKEVSTRQLINEIFRQGKICLVPKVNREKKCLEIYKIKQWLDLKRGFKGILEPRKNCLKITDYQSIDVAFIPLVAGDKENFRIGYGKGYFDKLFEKNFSSTKIIGLAFDFQILPKIPFEKHDVKVSFFITA